MSDFQPEPPRRALDGVPEIPHREFDGLNQDHQFHILRMVAARLGLNRADQVIHSMLTKNHYYRKPRAELDRLAESRISRG